MSRRGKQRETIYGNFGTVANTLLYDRGLTQSKLAKSLDLTPSYINQVFTNNKHASAKWVDMIADVLNLSEIERRELHLQAARDHGFKL